MVNFVRVEEGQVVESKIYEADFRRRFQDVSFPAVIDEQTELPEGYFLITSSAVPEYDWLRSNLVEAEPVFQNGKYVQQWVVTPKSQEELDTKAIRQDEVNKLVVTTSTGKTFDGDEVAQNRMARAVVAMEAGEETQWILADNTVVMVTREELREALRLAGSEQTPIWVSSK